MPQYGTSVFHSGFMGTAAFNASGFSVNTSSGTPVMTAPTVITATELPVIDYSNNPTAEIQEIMNSMSGPNPLKEVTFVDDKEITISIDNDFARDFYSSAGVNLTPGTQVPWVLLFLHQSAKSKLDGQYVAYSSVIVKSSPIKLEVKGRVALQFKMEANGPIFYPKLSEGTTPS